MQTLAEISTDELQLGECEDELAKLEVLVRRAKARQMRLVGAINDRVRRVAIESRRENDEHSRDLAGRRATRRAAEQLVSDLNWTPSDARRAERTSGQLRAHPRLAEAFAAGTISQRHVSLAADVLRHVDGDTATELERELVAAAAEMNPIEFSKLCRKRLIGLRYEVSVRDERLRRSRRSVRMTAGADGMLHLSARLSGTDAELVAAAVKGFRRPDGSEVPVRDRRSPEQVTADALIEVCDVALGAGKAPKRHTVRPHIAITIDWQTVVAGHGEVQVDELGVLPFDEVRRLLADAGVSRILVDAEQVPLEAGRQVRTVPAGLWRALKLRDGGCIRPGCSIPAEWCQIAHLEQPYRLGGRLSPLNAALLCHQHHGLFDHNGWRVVWEGNRPVLHPPERGASSDGDARAIEAWSGVITPDDARDAGVPVAGTPAARRGARRDARRGARRDARRGARRDARRGARWGPRRGPRRGRAPPHRPVRSKRRTCKRAGRRGRHPDRPARPARAGTRLRGDRPRLGGSCSLSRCRPGAACATEVDYARGTGRVGGRVASGDGSRRGTGCVGGRVASRTDRTRGRIRSGPWSATRSSCPRPGLGCPSGSVRQRAQSR
jgi:hypothetical protein